MDKHLDLLRIRTLGGLRRVTNLMNDRHAVDGRVRKRPGRRIWKSSSHSLLIINSNTMTKYILLSLLIVNCATSFVPQVATVYRPLATSLQFKDRDEIAHEIAELQGDVVPSTSHDENPWKEILNREHPHNTVEQLKRDLRHHEKDNAKQVALLERKLFALYRLSVDLTLKGIAMSQELIQLRKERDSLRTLVGRLVHVLFRRVTYPFRKVGSLVRRRKA